MQIFAQLYVTLHLNLNNIIIYKKKKDEYFI